WTSIRSSSLDRSSPSSPDRDMAARLVFFSLPSCCYCWEARDGRRSSREGEREATRGEKLEVFFPSLAGSLKRAELVFRGPTACECGGQFTVASVA
ncbi:hypothetical protein M419DRAFT_118092, partial [Trichoderma reesei RUT C-30]